MAKILVIITTYDRATMISETLSSLNRNMAGHDVDLWIYDDCSPINYLGDNAKYRFQENNGKRNYWKVINKILQDIKDAPEYDYYFQIPDDITLNDGFFDKSIKAWEDINDKRKICLNLLIDSYRKGKPCWTGVYPVKVGEVMKTQWVDMCYISKLSFFKELDFEIRPIDPSRWKGNELLGSGVGWQISIRLDDKKYNMYQVKKSLVVHGNHESKMNPLERGKNPLISL